MTHDLVDRGALVSSLKTFRGYLDDLERVAFDHASTKLRLVMNYAQKDPVVRTLSELLRLHLPSHEFLEGVMHGEVTIPEQPLSRLAYGYNMLLHIKMGWKLNLREILSRSEFAGGGLDARWKTFQKKFVKPLHGSVDEIARWLDGNAPQGFVDPDTVFREALAALFGEELGGSAATPAPAPAPAAPAAAPASAHVLATPALRALADAVRASQGAHSDLLLDVELLELELEKDAPVQARLDELLAGFAAAGLSEAAQACLEPESTPAPAPDPAPAPAPAPTPVVAAGDDGLAGERAALAAERRAIDAERKAITAQRAALDAERNALAAEREALAAERAAVEAQRG